MEKTKNPTLKKKEKREYPIEAEQKKEKEGGKNRKVEENTNKKGQIFAANASPIY
jgi:hypothetical protein